MPKFLISGDVHSCWGDVFDYLNKDKYDIVLCVGDLSEYIDQPLPTYFCIGNHEDHEVIESKVKTGQIKNLHCLTPDKPIYFDQIKVLGLRGNYAESRFLKSRKEHPCLFLQDRRRHYNFEDFKIASQQVNINIFLTHETIQEMELIRRGRNVGRPEISELLKTLKPKFYFSGHIHEAKVTNVLDTVCVSLPYPSENAYYIDTDKGTHGWIK